MLRRLSLRQLTGALARASAHPESSAGIAAAGAATTAAAANASAAGAIRSAPAGAAFYSSIARGAALRGPSSALGGAAGALGALANTGVPASSSSSAFSFGGQRRGIFIQTQSTPNPASLMFLPGKTVMIDGTGSKNFANPREGMASPLAKKLFNVDGVTGVFFGADFVTVTKSDEYDWGVLKPEVFAAVMDFYASGENIITEEDELNASGTAISEDDDEIVAMIKELLETRIRPAVAEDGGDIIFKGWDEKTGVVTVKMQGACDGCPSSSVTLKSGIENMLRHYVPEVTAVVQEEQEGSMDLLDMASMNR
mmetsp:Transcript_6727/g.17238  ORF Transcript_6727/g.17238 Transcript_6727/m.17238 type:complete len:311 (-) Transcript_6727:361-1293(-)|eukprot:CAMPEP_0197611488 /NCGR_PEP_ID=MMETSP1326-20131121/55476_1 /TAXON_ID=1155430 /ORGANISM="Genus nov. species nov., Strain RCC2288" /LENGTH=310 /DNA_ID=CAMNT_0043180143 /DNA_START=234 /DNA_END=1166 /DNA_ORIENTATION=+